ncbi:MAG: NAD-dependent epimerase/dehydratase family protein [bacterium]|nr:NAD-dependent epimerase/dehydratase family protein [bacterium]
MRVFITGGTGYIGSSLCRRLKESGHQVRALVRSTSNTAALEAIGAETFVGDITDRYSMREAMSGADWVVHAAAELDFRAPMDRIEGANVAGSENVASLAFKLGVGRVLLLSSIAAFGSSPSDGSPVAENARIELPFPSAYGATKHAGEQAFAALADRGLAVNVVYPSLVYGPPGKRGGLNAMFGAIIEGRLPAIVGGGQITRWVYLEDLVTGLLKVMERARPGRDYLMTGDASRLGEVVEKVAELAGVEPPKRRMSVWRARLMGRVLNPLFTLRGKRPPINMSQLESLRRHWNFEDARARAELEWGSRPLETGLPETVRYLTSDSQ